MSVSAQLIVVSAHSMDVAVIIPVLNGEVHISETLDAVRAQHLQPKEIVVVDDGSTDRTTDVVHEYEEVTLLNNPGQGPSAARNHGFQHTEAEAVAFLDHDDLWHPKHLGLLVDVLQKNPAFPVASAHRVTFSGDEKPNFAFTGDEPTVATYDPWVDFPLNKIHEPVCHLIRRRAVNEVNGWSSAYDGLADYHLLLKLALVGPIARIEDRTAAYRTRSDSYFRSLTKKRGHEHYALLAEACKDLLDRRRKRELPVDEYLWRWESINALAMMMQAWVQGNTSQFREAVWRFDSSIAPLSSELVREITQKFYWWVSPYLRTSLDTEFVEEALRWLRWWPSGADRARQALFGCAFSRHSTRSLIRRSVPHPNVWPYLLGHIVRRMQAKMASYSNTTGSLSWAK